MELLIVQHQTDPETGQAHGNSCLRTIATWLFVLPVFTEGVLPDVVKLEVAGLTVLMFLVLMHGIVPLQAVERIYVIFGALTLVVITYIALQPWPHWAGTVRSYDVHAALFPITYGFAAVFAVLFFEEQGFTRVMWRAATTSLWVSMAACAVSRWTGRLLLVNPADETLRMAGTLTEPSAWAAPLTVVLLLALLRRSWLYVALSLTGLFVADSPTCILVMVVTVPAWYALTATGRYRALARAVVCAGLVGAFLFVQHASPQAFPQSGSTTSASIGRLVAGIRNVETGGEEGVNTRYASTTAVIADVRDNGWMHLGAGPAADQTWFPAEFPAASGAAYQPNALWVSVLFDFGEVGLIVLAALMLTAAWRMRSRRDLAAVLLPFFAASLVNSAASGYVIVALGIILFATMRASQLNTDTESAVVLHRETMANDPGVQAVQV